MRPAASTSGSVLWSTTSNVVQVPVVPGRVARLWDGLEGNEVEVISTPSDVTHLTFSR